MFFFFLLLNSQIIIASENWYPVNDSSLLIKDGSALDFSFLVGERAAGEGGRVVINAQGKFALEETPNVNKRFLCSSIAWSPISGGYPSHELAKLYARQLKLHGYNLVRLHYLDAHLMSGRDRDFQYDSEQLDRVYFFLSALKKEGIYWIVDGMTSDNGAYGGVLPHRWVKKYNLKLRMYYEDSVRSHWIGLVESLWNKENPYTGKTVLEDKALMGVILTNENGLNFLLRDKVPNFVAIDFNRWLRKKYKTTQSLNLSWNGSLSPNENLESFTVRPPKNATFASIRQKDFQSYIRDKELELANWQTSYLQSIGYKGLVTGYNNWHNLSAAKSRSQFDWVDVHAYHDEVLSFEIGATIKQTSSFSNQQRYLRSLLNSSLDAKPFTVSEYGQPFWNKYRYESGLVVSGMASFQGWDMICQHSQGAIDLSYANTAPRKKMLTPYSIGLDPILRAGETLSALFFLRRDVQESNHRFIIDLSSEDWSNNLGSDYLRVNNSRLGFLSGFRLSFSKERKKQPSERTTRIKLSKKNKVIDLESVVDRMRKDGLLSERNKTSVRNGIFHSDTDQILIDFKSDKIKVSTDYTIASTFKKYENFDLDYITIRNPSSDGMIAFSSLDNSKLKESSKILVILTSDARNTNMALSHNEKKLESWGTFPVRLKHVALKVFIPTSEALKVSRLNLRGDIVETTVLKLSSSLEGQELIFDNYSKEFGATTFFLLEKI